MPWQQMIRTKINVQRHDLIDEQLNLTKLERLRVLICFCKLLLLKYLKCKVSMSSWDDTNLLYLSQVVMAHGWLHPRVCEAAGHFFFVWQQSTDRNRSLPYPCPKKVNMT